MYSSNLSMADTIPQGILKNYTCRQFTHRSLVGKIVCMPEFTPDQLLLMHIRDTYCGGKAAELARKIGKDGTYVHRLFYPIGKKARKGIGLEIMKTCSSVFGLAPGFWESAPSAKPHDPLQSHTVQEATPEYFWWPFSDKVKPWQYKLLSDTQKMDVEKYILLQISAKDPPADQLTPANNERTGTYL